MVSWFDDPNDHTLLDLIPFFEHLDKADDIYSFLANDNLPSTTTMYVGSIPHGSIPEDATPIFSPPAHGENDDGEGGEIIVANGADVTGSSDGSSRGSVDKLVGVENAAGDRASLVKPDGVVSAAGDRASVTRFGPDNSATAGNRSSVTNFGVDGGSGDSQRISVGRVETGASNGAKMDTEPEQTVEL